MSEPKSYDVMTIVGICRIPPDRLPVFLAEFPKVIPHIRAMIELQEACYKAAGIEYTDADLLDVINGGKWIDDDAGNIDVHVSAHEHGESSPAVKIHIHENHKTGAFSVSGGAA